MSKYYSILFVVSDFDTGGITTSLRNLTNVLIKAGHRVGIVNLAKIKALPADFNDKIELVPLDSKAALWNLSVADIKQATPHKFPKILGYAIAKKLLNKYGVWSKFIFSSTFITGYDIAVAFRQSPLCYYFAGNHVSARRKIGFWHGDPCCMEGINKWISSLHYMDYIACVSNAVRISMENMFPQYTDKYKTVYNIFDVKEIMEKSTEFNPGYCREKINIVSVSRIDFSQKQIFFIPHVAQKLKKNAIDFHWTVVGDGPDYIALKNLVEKLRVEDCVFCVGNKNNPFPYMARADLFVNTSLCEAYGMVITEALILGLPCVAIDYPALREIISDKKNGIAVHSSIDELANEIYKIVSDKSLLEKLKSNARAYRYSCAETYEAFTNLCQ